MVFLGGAVGRHFSDFLNQFASGAVTLPLIHCTTAATGLDVFDKGELAPNHCKVYDSDLIYLFYGRPAYKPEVVHESVAMPELAPVCLILDPKVLVTAVRILPFDSGGFQKYRDLLGPKLERDEFEMGLTVDAPGRLVQAFYETNRNYYDQKPTLSSGQLSLSDLTARGYSRLISYEGEGGFDDRSSTVEIQVASSIRLRDALKAVIAPSIFLDDPTIIAALKSLPGVTTLTYKTYGRSKPLSYANGLYERVDTFIEDDGGFA